MADNKQFENLNCTKRWSVGKLPLSREETLSLEVSVIFKRKPVRGCIRDIFPRDNTISRGKQRQPEREFLRKRRATAEGSTYGGTERGSGSPIQYSRRKVAENRVQPS